MPLAWTPPAYLGSRGMGRAWTLPLNLDQNRSHPFHSTLTRLRADARARARAQPVMQS